MGDGEDGPTHQPVEHLLSLRAIPGLVTLRPGDANEVVEAYRYIMQLRHKPAVLVLSRQPLPTLDRSKYAVGLGGAHGAYVLADAPSGKPEVILIATGSEVSLAVDAYEKLVAEGIRSRVVSMPSWDIFDHQPAEYRDSVLPPNVDGPRRHRTGVNIGLGALRRTDGTDHRDEDVRRVGPAEGAADGSSASSRITWSRQPRNRSPPPRPPGSPFARRVNRLPIDDRRPPRSHRFGRQRSGRASVWHSRHGRASSSCHNGLESLALQRKSRILNRHG